LEAQARYLLASIISVLVSVWLWFKPQLPGVAAVLLGGIAAIMAFRDMHHTHKWLFTGAMLALVYLEFRDIRVDRIELDRKALEDRAQQNLQFQSIRKKQEEEFEQTAQGLKEAIGGIDSTLQQIRPYARVHFSGGFGIANAPPPPLFSAGGQPMRRT
jgi:hypothetical protein